MTAAIRAADLRPNHPPTGVFAIVARQIAAMVLLNAVLAVGVLGEFQNAGAEEPDASGLEPLVQLLTQVDDAEFQLDILKGIRDGLAGRKTVAMPPSWPKVYQKLATSSQEKVRSEARLLALILGDPQAVKSLREVMMDAKGSVDERRSALAALVERRTPELAPLLQKLIAEPPLRSAAISALAAYDDPATPQIVLGSYADLNPGERQDAINALASRVVYAAALLDAMEQGRVDRRDVSAYTARQLQSLGNEELTARLVKVWGEIRVTSQDRQTQIAKFKALLSPQAIKNANLSRGRLVYSRTCQQCHRLYGEGAQIGPDLTGSNRANLDYVLENVIDPSAVIGKDYQLTIVATEDGRVISGIMVETTDRAVTLLTVTERIVLSREDIEEMRRSPLSMMPENQFEKLATDEIRDLVAYLATQQQVPLPEGTSAGSHPPEANTP